MVVGLVFKVEILETQRFIAGAMRASGNAFLARMLNVFAPDKISTLGG
jgi:hypothetical protein